MFAYLDRNALFAGQWQLRKTQQQSREAYEAMLAEKAEPVLQAWKQRCIREGLLTPRVAYGYFPCGRSGNDLVADVPQHSSPRAIPDAPAMAGPSGAPTDRFSHRHRYRSCHATPSVRRDILARST